MDENTSAKATDEKIEEIKPEFEIKVTADQLSVYVRLADNGVKNDVLIQEAEVFSLLEKNAIKHGIMNDDIKDFCSSRNYFQWRKVALGTHAVDGEDGSYALTFDPGSTGPQEREDGSVDYRELGLIKNVYQGEVLCNLVLPAEGVDGINVYGGSIIARQGKPAGAEAGDNVLLTDDKTELIAEKDGCVYFRRGKVLVEEAYSVRENVSLKTGNINFNGSVLIAESVLQGFKVTAQKDIYVKGRVEGAELTAGGNIVIVGGVIGMNLAKIEAEGDVTAKFIENAAVTCGGNLTCDIILMSDIKVEKAILMRGEKSAIIGGQTLAGEKIIAKTLGSNKYPKQEVSVRKNWKFYEQSDEEKEEEQANAKANRMALKKKLADAEKYLEMFSNKIKEETSLGPNKNIVALKEYMIKKSELSSVVSSLKNLIESYKEEEFLSSITCTGFVYPGVRLCVDNCWMNVNTEIQNQKFYVNDGEIVAGAVLPGERDF